MSNIPLLPVLALALYPCKQYYIYSLVPSDQCNHENEHNLCNIITPMHCEKNGQV